MSLRSLPKELLISITELLDRRDLAAVLRASRYFCQTLQHELEVRKDEITIIANFGESLERGARAMQNETLVDHIRTINIIFFNFPFGCRDRLQPTKGSSNSLLCLDLSKDERQYLPAWATELFDVLLYIREKARNLSRIKIANHLDDQHPLPFGHTALARAIECQPDYSTLFELGHESSHWSECLTFGWWAVLIIGKALDRQVQALTMDFLNIDRVIDPTLLSLVPSHVNRRPTHAVDGPSMLAIRALSKNTGLVPLTLDIKSSWLTPDFLRHPGIITYPSCGCLSIAPQYGELGAVEGGFRAVRSLTIDFGRGARSCNDCDNFFEHVTLQHLQCLMVVIPFERMPSGLEGFRARHSEVLQELVITTLSSCTILQAS